MEKLRYNYNFWIWFNDKDSKIQEISTDDIMEKLENLTRDILGFWTIGEVQKWVYTHENWEKVTEYSVTINRKTEESSPELVNKFVKAVKSALNQESVLVSLTRERVQFA